MGRASLYPSYACYAQDFKSIAEEANPQQWINLLKMPTCIRECSDTILEILEQRAQQKFEGNIWKMVAWAEQEGLDVRSPPVRLLMD